MPIGTILKEIFGGADIVKTVGDIVDQNIYNKEEKARDANLAVEKAHEFELRREELDQAEFDKVLANHLEYYKTDAVDRASARDTEIKVLNAPNVSWINANIRPVLATFVMVVAFGFFYLLVFRKQELRSVNDNVLFTILGGIIGYVSSILGFYFGSSSGSMEKDATIKNLTK
jgi:hypothetical protein